MLITEGAGALYEPATPPTHASPGLLHLGASTLYVGTLGAVRRHAHAVPVYLAGLGGSFGLRAGPAGRWMRCRTAVVPGGLVHELDTGDQPVAVCYPAVDATDAHGLSRWVGNGGFADGCWVGRSGETGLFRELFEHRDSHAWSGEALNDLLSRTRGRAAPLDPRLRRVLREIESAPQHAIPVAVWAAACGISAGRFMHLFAAQLGMPYRRYRTWCRLRHSMQFAGAGGSLTDAALASGFSDSQHFSREFSHQIGVAPSAILRLVGRIGRS